MASTIAAACGTGATTECGLSEVPPGVSKKPSDLSQAAQLRPMTYMDKNHRKHKTSLKKKSPVQEGAASTDLNHFVQLIYSLREASSAMYMLLTPHFMDVLRKISPHKIWSIFTMQVHTSF